MNDLQEIQDPSLVQINHLLHVIKNTNEAIVFAKQNEMSQLSVSQFEDLKEGFVKELHELLTEMDIPFDLKVAA